MKIDFHVSIIINLKKERAFLLFECLLVKNSGLIQKI